MITFDQMPQEVSQLRDDVANLTKLIVKQFGQREPEPDRFLTITQAGEFLNLSVPTIYSLVSRGRIPSMKKTKRLYFSKDELIKWLKEGRKKMLSDYDAEADDYLSKKKGGKS